MSDEYRITVTIGGHEVTVSSSSAKWTKDTFEEVFEKSVEPAKKLPTGFSVTGGQFEVSYE